MSQKRLGSLAAFTAVLVLVPDTKWITVLFLQAPGVLANDLDAHPLSAQLESDVQSGSLIL